MRLLRSKKVGKLECRGKPQLPSPLWFYHCGAWSLTATQEHPGCKNQPYLLIEPHPSSFIETTDKLLCILERLLSSHTLRALFCRHGAYKELDAICTIAKIKWWRCQAVENKQIKASQTYPKRVLLLPCWNWNMETQFSPFGGLSCSPRNPAFTWGWDLPPPPSSTPHSATCCVSNWHPHVAGGADKHPRACFTLTRSNCSGQRRTSHHAGGGKKKKRSAAHCLPTQDSPARE